MSHEIRTPMNGILGMTRLLRNTKMTGDQDKFTNAIFTSADNLMVIINEILDFSKIEAGKLMIEEIPFDLRDLVHIWDETLKLNAIDKNIGFEINVDQDVPNNLVGDPIRLNQIIYNLGGNAIKFTEKGKVLIKVSVEEKLKNGVAVRVDINDNGIGIPKDKLASIFLSFSQASSSTTREYGGTGLGLSITKQLVELQNGKLWVESEFGEGSTFSFVLKYSIQDETSVKVVKKESVINIAENKLGDVKILLVEDHPINQMLAITVLEGWGFDVELAENGYEAVDNVRNNSYDVVLMDIHMPKMDGYKATQVIRQEIKSSIPIIAMTASAQIGDNEKCFDVGMNDYISKPFDPEVLLDKISNQIINKAA
jgi:CheY-like chemotaxis protein